MPITGDNKNQTSATTRLSRFYESAGITSKPDKQQRKVLLKLLDAARETSFGKKYDLQNMMDAGDVVSAFQKAIPIHDYESMKEWWGRALRGEKDVVTKGYLHYFALSSGTSDGASKYIPVSKKQLWQFKRQTLKFSLNIALNNALSASVFSKHHLLIGGSIDLNFTGASYIGDLSGIIQLKIPFWYQPFSKPSREVMAMPWEDKIAKIVRDAPSWNVSIITGVPSWVQVILEKIIAHHHLKSIHDIWPELKVYIHSGIRADPYRKSINALFGEEVFWYESYLASEGFFAFQKKAGDEGMQMILGDGNFYEFIPFNEENFDEQGNVRPGAKTISIAGVKEDTDYALLITTCSGAWRYLIGDTIRFIDSAKAKIIVTGRTKHFLSVTGEHLSVDNMNKAVELVTDTMRFNCKEFTVYAESENGRFVHVWNIGCDEQVDKTALTLLLDEKLKELNDDYRTERSWALSEPEINLVPNHKFYQFLNNRGKAGGQVKFPRVLNGAILEDWKKFLI